MFVLIFIAILIFGFRGKRFEPKVLPSQLACTKNKTFAKVALASSNT